MPTVKEVIDLFEIRLDKKLQDLPNTKLTDTAKTLMSNLFEQILG